MKKPNPPKAETLAKNPLICPTCGASRDVLGSSGGKLLAWCRNCEGDR